MNRIGPLSAAVVLASLVGCSAAFALTPGARTCVGAGPRIWAPWVGPLASEESCRVLRFPTVALRASSSSPEAVSTGRTPSSSESALFSSVNELKNVLEREYASFFNPMERDWYSEHVTFEDPMFSLSGVEMYQSNVDMLAARTLLGKVLFRDAGIVLHSVTGGALREGDGGVGSSAKTVAIDDIVTRWTLRFTFQGLPWQPTARFTGISVYSVVPGGPKGVQVVQQLDYWDSINLRPGGGDTYEKVDKAVAVSDFLNQIRPTSLGAPSAGPELPYSLLRRGDGYEVRRYPAFAAVETNYERRDEGFLSLGSVTSGTNPLSPAIMTVQPDRPKSMSWPVAYAAPGSSKAAAENPSVPSEVLRRLDDDSEGDVRAIQIPERVLAVRTFSDASVESVVRRCDQELRDLCARDGLVLSASSSSHLQFAQYDAVYTMGKRRGEVWVELQEGTHPWSRPR